MLRKMEDGRYDERAEVTFISRTQLAKTGHRMIRPIRPEIFKVTIVRLQRYPYVVTLSLHHLRIFHGHRMTYLGELRAQFDRFVAPQSFSFAKEEATLPRAILSRLRIETVDYSCIFVQVVVKFGLERWYDIQDGRLKEHCESLIIERHRDSPTKY